MECVLVVSASSFSVLIQFLRDNVYLLILQEIFGLESGLNPNQTTLKIFMFSLR